ncbi:MAG: hypothetical protein BRC58_09495, partial [Cyanobacteria bacterium QS_8_64_29]
MQLLLRLLLAFIFAICLAFGLGERPAAAELETVTFENENGQTVEAPDWSEISFSDFPAIQQSGNLQVGSGLGSELGYDPSRSWQA